MEWHFLKAPLHNVKISRWFPTRSIEWPSSMVNRLSFRGIPFKINIEFCASSVVTYRRFLHLSDLNENFLPPRQKRFKTNSIQFCWSDHFLGLVAFTMKSHSGQKWSRLFLRCFFRTTSLDVVPSSEMQINPSRIDIVLERFLLVGREFILPVEN